MARLAKTVDHLGRRRRRVTVGSMGIAGPIERLCDGRRPRPEFVDYVLEAARAVSRELGAIPW